MPLRNQAKKTVSPNATNPLAQVAIARTFPSEERLSASILPPPAVTTATIAATTICAASDPTTIRLDQPIVAHGLHGRPAATGSVCGSSGGSSGGSDDMR